MKIHQLPMGTHFEYEGVEYVKSGPMFATGPAGQRLIPKYAVLRPLGQATGVPAPPRAEPLPRAEVLRTFEDFYAACAGLVPEDRRAALAAARERFLKALG